MAITRTIVTTTIHSSEVIVKEGIPSLAPLKEITKIGTCAISSEKASKIAIEANKGKVVAVTGIDTKEEIRGMDLATFLANSKIIERPASQQKGNK